MIATKSQFYYGIEITEFNRLINFREDTDPPLVATLSIGLYSHEEFIRHLQLKLNEFGLLTYIVSFERTDRKITISVVSGTFDLLSTSGSAALSGIWELIGFQGADKTGLATYTGSFSAGSSFRPQFKLQGYVSTDQNSTPVESSLNVSGSGKRELVTFGTEKVMECWIPYITNLYQAAGSPIEYDPSGFNEAKSFMAYAIKGGHIEFMPDRTAANTFETLQLKSTAESDQGIAYRIEEMQDQGLQNYFRINKLTFRKIEA